jgi:hypothetical protein
MITCKDLKNNQYSEKELEKHMKDFDWSHWHAICFLPDLSESFMEKYEDKLYWEILARHQSLSEEFINKHKEKSLGDFIYNVWQYQTLSENFLLNNIGLIEKTEIKLLKKNKSISDELLEKVKIMKELSG